MEKRDLKKGGFLHIIKNMYFGGVYAELLPMKEYTDKAVHMQ